MGGEKKDLNVGFMLGRRVKTEKAEIQPTLQETL
jgi:hypothetical protein